MSSWQNPLFYLNDKLHASNLGVTVTAKSFTAGTTTAAGTATDGGYSPNAVRDTNFKWAWKAPDNNAYDNDLEFDLGSTSWLSGPFVVIMAYDARGADQTKMQFQQDVADSPTGAFATNKGQLTLNTAGPTLDRFTVSNNSSRRYYRFRFLQSDRGGGTKMPKIYACSAFQTTYDIVDVNASYQNNTIMPAAISNVSQVGTMPGIATLHTNVNGADYEEFDVPFDKVESGLWLAFREQFYSMAGLARAFYIQWGFLKNLAGDDFAMVRLRDVKRPSIQAQQGLFDQSLPLMTERRPL